MSQVNHNFLFASLDSKRPSSSRQVHIRRLYDILQLCIQRNDMPRARRAWAILVRCKEIHWKWMWTTGLLVLGKDVDGLEANLEKLVFLRSMMLQHPEERELVIKELVLCLILAGKHREALDELDLYLPAFPYQDNPVLHIYAGFLSLYLARPSIGDIHHAVTNDASLLRDAHAHFERAKTLDAANLVATAFLNKLPSIAQGYINTCVQPTGPDTDEENMNIDDSLHLPRKRVRT